MYLFTSRGGPNHVLLTVISRREVRFDGRRLAIEHWPLTIPDKSWEHRARFMVILNDQIINFKLAFLLKSF